MGSGRCVCSGCRCHRCLHLLSKPRAPHCQDILQAKRNIDSPSLALRRSKGPSLALCRSKGLPLATLANFLVAATAGNLWSACGDCDTSERLGFRLLAGAAMACLQRRGQPSHRPLPHCVAHATCQLQTHDYKQTALTCAVGMTQTTQLAQTVAHSSWTRRNFLCAMWQTAVRRCNNCWRV